MKFGAKSKVWDADKRRWTQKKSFLLIYKPKNYFFILLICVNLRPIIILGRGWTQIDAEKTFFNNIKN